MSRSVLKWELIGIATISILGAILHFVFDWSGQWEPLGVIAAVNESVWEHFKIGFWPALLYAIVEYPFLKKYTNNFLIAKAACVYVIPVTIAIVFYSYTSVFGQEILLVDISIFVLAIALGQLASYRILTLSQLQRWFNGLGVFLIIILAVAFGVFTFYPPHLSIFLDATGVYGIP
jgi:hypothetical protein